MPRRHPYAHCKGCGKHRTKEPGGILSARGWCRECGQERSDTNALQLVNKRGEYFEHYVRKSYMAARRMKLQVEKAS